MVLYHIIMPQDSMWTTSIRWTPEIDRKLTRMVQRVLASAGKTSRSEVLAALVASQEPDLKHVQRLLETYRDQFGPDASPKRRSVSRRRPGPVALPRR
jgi:hypothetical protein